MTAETTPNNLVSRRAFLRGVLATAGIGMLYACGASPESNNTLEQGEQPVPLPTPTPLTNFEATVQPTKPAPTAHYTPIPDIPTITPEAVPTRPLDRPVGINGNNLFDITNASSPEQFGDHSDLPAIRDSFVSKLAESGFSDVAVNAIEGYDQDGVPRSDVISFLERDGHTYAVIGVVEGQSVSSLRYMDLTDLQSTGVIGGNIQLYKDWAYNPDGSQNRDRWVIGLQDNEEVIPLGALTTFDLKGLAITNEMGDNVANLITLREDVFETSNGLNSVYEVFGLPQKPPDAAEYLLSINALTGRFELHAEDDARGVPDPTVLRYTLATNPDTGEMVWEKVIDENTYFHQMESEWVAEGFLPDDGRHHLVEKEFDGVEMEFIGMRKGSIQILISKEFAEAYYPYPDTTKEPGEVPVLNPNVTGVDDVDERLGTAGFVVHALHEARNGGKQILTDNQREWNPNWIDEYLQALQANEIAPYNFEIYTSEGGVISTESLGMVNPAKPVSIYFLAPSITADDALSNGIIGGHPDAPHQMPIRENNTGFYEPIVEDGSLSIMVSPFTHGGNLIGSGDYAVPHLYDALEMLATDKSGRGPEVSSRLPVFDKVISRQILAHKVFDSNGKIQSAQFFVVWGMPNIED